MNASVTQGNSSCNLDRPPLFIPHCGGCTQIVAPSNELTPPMSMVRFDWIGSGQNAGFPMQTLRVVQGWTAGNVEGSGKLI